MNAISESLHTSRALLTFATKSIVRRSYVREVALFCLFVTAFYLAYRFGMSFSPECSSPFWFPDSVLLCALLSVRPRRWWIYVFAALPIRLYVAVPTTSPWWFLLSVFAIDSVKGVLTATALRRYIKNPLCLETIRDFSIYCLFAVVLAPTLTAFAGAGARYSLGHAFWPSWERWFMTDALTHLIVTPAILYWVLESSRQQRHPLPRKQYAEGVLLAGGLLVSCYMAFHFRPVLFGLAEIQHYAPVPFLLWAAIRFGMRGASGALVILVVLSVQAAIGGQGPFAGLSTADTALALQHFLLLSVTPIYVIAIVIEQQMNMDRSLRESETRFRTMADTAPVMIWMSGPDKKCTYFNKRWLEFTGRPHEAESGDGWIANVHPQDVGNRVFDYYTAFDDRLPFKSEYRLLRHDGEYRWILASAVPRTTADGEFLGYIGSCMDITERKEAENEAQRQQTERAHVARISTMGQLAFALAHELNQPLGSILRNTEAAELILRQDSPDHEEVRAILADIRQDDQRAGAVIDRMRSLLKRRNLEFEPISVKEVFEQGLLLVRAEMLSRRVTLQTNLPECMPMVRGDRVHLQQVLLNLLVNGADSMKGLPLEQRQLLVQVSRIGPETLEAAISDAGHGIAAKELPRLFEPFFTTKSNGMGMGLAISKTIIEAHGGRIWAVNNAGGGATFRFTLKVAISGGST